MLNIALDSHKRYTFASVSRASDGAVIDETRVEHFKGAITNYLRRFADAPQVALESIGSWYWIVDEIEAAGKEPLLVHAYKAKMMSGRVNKTDKLDARAMNQLARSGTLPTVWIPDTASRDERELLRTRMVLTGMRTRLKNRLHSLLDKYALRLSGGGDVFGARNRGALRRLLGQLPPHSAESGGLLLEQLESVEAQVADMDKQIGGMQLQCDPSAVLRTLPGVGPILSAVISSEIGDISRFASAASLASYSGTVPPVHSSGDRCWHGPSRRDVNHYLKWAYYEAANTVSAHALRWRGRHVAELYLRIRKKKGHGKACGAVARHLATATWHMLTKDMTYTDPGSCAKSRSEREDRLGRQ